MPDEQKIPVVCPRCSVQFKISPPQPDIFNGLRTSSVIASHDKAVRCINCRQGFVIVLAGVQVAWQAQAVEDSVLEPLEESKILLATLTLRAMPGLK